MAEDKGQILLYQTPDGESRIEVRLQNETVWLSLDQMANLDMIISVGYRVHSYRGVQFRMWATRVLKEYIVKGFALNDDLLKRAGGGTSYVYPEQK